MTKFLPFRSNGNSQELDVRKDWKAATEAPSKLQPNQRALDETFTIALALSGHVNDLFCERGACGSGPTVKLNPGALEAFPRFVQRADHYVNGLGVEVFGVFTKVPDHVCSLVLEAGA